VAGGGPGWASCGRSVGTARAPWSRRTEEAENERPRPPMWKGPASDVEDGGLRLAGSAGSGCPVSRSRQPLHDLAAVPEGGGGGHGQADLTREPTGAGRCGLQVLEVVTGVRLDGAGASSWSAMRRSGRAGRRKAVGRARRCCHESRTPCHRGRCRARRRGLSGRPVASPRTNGPVLRVEDRGVVVTCGRR
jgi:hypothetical protein